VEEVMLVDWEALLGVEFHAYSHQALEPMAEDKQYLGLLVGKRA
jgi:hypothetical protein